ncbi:hypothetical protein [Winogradskyella sp. R77965]|uniref:hypothetical protein n=1 Tax=Winogradskyella sp. R77965 TaxID=3093872 RepID=UPI0037DC6AB2
MRNFITGIFLVFMYLGFSQASDTLYYNAYWSKTTKDKALFYRLLPLQKKGSLYVVKDYYIDGTLQMEAFSSSEQKDVFQGDVIWYYANGKKRLQQTFKDHKIEGREKSYFRDGTLMSSGLYKNGRQFSGSFYLSDTAVDKTADYNDGKLISRNAYYEASKRLARKTYYNHYTYAYEKTVYFNPKGDALVSYKEFNRDGLKTGITRVYVSTNENANIETIVFIKSQAYENDTLVTYLKDKAGKLIAKGIYKGDYPYKGQFFKDNRLERYEGSMLNGETIFYDDAFNEVARGVYKSGKEWSGSFRVLSSEEIQKYEAGQIIGKITKNKYTGELYECTFKDYNPIDGEYFNFNGLESYSNGYKTKMISYDYDTGRVKSITHYVPDSYNTDQVIYFNTDGTESIVTYKNGLPYSGKAITNSGYMTYVNGKTSGPFLIEDYKVSIKGHYKDFMKMEGEVLYIFRKTKDTVRCIFKDGKPYTGTQYEWYNFENYKNGKKEGWSYMNYSDRRFAYDSLTIKYKEDKPIDTATYYLKDKIIAETEYRDGKPYNGIVYKGENHKIYKDGDLIEAKYANYRHYKKYQFFSNNLLNKEVVRDYNTDTLKYEIIYKDQKPYNGKQIYYDSINTKYIETAYSLGKKQGLQTTYKRLSEKFITQYNFKADKKEGEAKFNTKFSDTTFIAIYKDDKPINGIVIKDGKDFITKSEYQDAQLLSNSYYTISSYSPKFMTKIDYKNEKPYNGMELEYVDKKRIVKTYESGKLIKTLIGAYRFRDGGEPDAQYKVYHFPKMDSIVMTSSFKPGRCVIKYQNKSKSKGSFEMYKLDALMGSGAFKNKTLTAFDYKYYHKDKGLERIALKDKKLIFDFSIDPFRAHFELDSPQLKLPMYNSILKLTDFKGTDETYIDLYLNGENGELLSKVYMKDGKPYNGIFFMPNKEKFDVIKVTNGERSERFYGLSATEAVEKIKILNSKKD